MKRKPALETEVDDIKTMDGTISRSGVEVTVGIEEALVVTDSERLEVRASGVEVFVSADADVTSADASWVNGDVELPSELPSIETAMGSKEDRPARRLLAFFISITIKPLPRECMSGAPTSKLELALIPIAQNSTASSRRVCPAGTGVSTF
ncbi:hypothetical protein HDU84_000591 [Entophlyctis sp. JEL0112]|nr:hypothetical protein HDU84_000591 [Entophlyctis sp. JEL0112]